MDDEFGFWSDYAREDRDRRRLDQIAENEGVVVPPRVKFKYGSHTFYHEEPTSIRVWIEHHAK